MQSGDYVLMLCDIDDLSIGQLCRIISTTGDAIHVACWTGFDGWVFYRDVIPINVHTNDIKHIEELFEYGHQRMSPMKIQF